MPRPLRRRAMRGALRLPLHGVQTLLLFILAPLLCGAFLIGFTLERLERALEALA